MARTRSKRPEEPSETWDEVVIQSLIPHRLELGGIVLLVVAGVTILGLLRLTQSEWLDWWTGSWRRLLGWGAYPMFISVAITGVYIALRHVDLPFRPRSIKVLGVELMFLALLPLSYQFGDYDLPDAYVGKGGGLVGWALAEPLLDFLGPLLTAFFYLTLFAWGLALVVGISWQNILQALARTSELLQQWSRQLEPPTRPAKPSAASTDNPPISPPKTRLPLIEAKPRPLPEPEAPAGQDRRLPSLKLLEKGVVVNMSDDEIERKKAIIEQTLVDFGLSGEVTEIRRGPSVTQFGVTPGYLETTGPDGEPKLQKVRVSRIAALQKDLALALAVPRLRIEAPVPGRGIVGIEVPNAMANIVRLRTVLESPAFTQLNAPLAVALGQGVSGTPIAIDIAKMPHLLIAGTTGAGKSVCLNAFISCLVFNNVPEQLKMIMIDPKKVELIRFNGLPHLLGTVEVEHERVTGVLRWLIVEMDRRYEAFAQLGAKNLQTYNQKVKRLNSGKPLPYIAVFIDELADLMAMYGEEVERALCRLAQMARATGIHLVVATQRPSTDVITGLIKANFPARISFSVASSTDSRVILDTTGAEQLLGQGDMLFLSPEASEPVRVQGCFVSDNEVEHLVTHWQRAMPDFTLEEAPWEKLLAREYYIGERDDMLEEAIALAKKVETISTSLIQRRLRVGYPRAARLMEALYEMGLVEDPKEGGRTRQTFVDEDDDPLDDFLASREA